MAILLNDRVSLEAGKVWVHCGSDDPIQVALEQIRLAAVEVAN